MNAWDPGLYIRAYTIEDYSGGHQLRSDADFMGLCLGFGARTAELECLFG